MPMSTEVPAASQTPQRLYWRRVRWLTAGLMAAWAVVSFAVVFEARALTFTFFGWPFSFWWTGQGALLIFLALVGLYAHTMGRLDETYGTDRHD